MSVTDDVIDQHLPNKIINCSTARKVVPCIVRNIKYESNYEYVYQKRCNHSAGVALKCAEITTNRMHVKKNTTYMWREQAIIE